MTEPMPRISALREMDSPNTRGDKPALSREDLDPGRSRFSSAVSRQTVAIAIMVVPVVFAGKVLDTLGSDDSTVAGVVLVLAIAGAVGGAIYHPARRFCWRGAVAGVLIVWGAFAAFRGYQRVRSRPLSIEFAVVSLVGAIPGFVAYYVLMRDQRVGPGQRRSGGV